MEYWECDCRDDNIRHPSDWECHRCGAIRDEVIFPFVTGDTTVSGQ